MDTIKYFDEKRRMLDSLGRVKGKCVGAECSDCPFSHMNNGMELYCEELEILYPERAIEIIERWSREHPKIDWSQVTVDTPILVRELENGVWIKRHFAKYEDGEVYAWDMGKTSWTTTKITTWRYVKLAEEGGAK